MKISELKQIIETLEALGETDVNLVIDDSRDGKKSYPMATATPIVLGDQRERIVVLAISRE